MKRLHWIILKLSFNISKISFIVLISSSFNGVLALRIFSSSSLTRAVPQRTMSAAIFSIAYRSAIREMLCPKLVRSDQRTTGIVGDSDVGDIGMLVTSVCWWLYDGDLFKMLVAESLCWWFSQCIKSVTNILNQSLTSWIGHQHLKLVNNTFGLQHPSPTSM